MRASRPRTTRARTDRQVTSPTRRLGLRTAINQGRSIRLGFESLELRQLLASDNLVTWFETAGNVPRVPLASLSAPDLVYDESLVGPQAPVASEWIVQLKPEASKSIRSFEDVNALLVGINTQIYAIGGLGSEGLVLVRGFGVRTDDVRASLGANMHVESYNLN